MGEAHRRPVRGLISTLGVPAVVSAAGLVALAASAPGCTKPEPRPPRLASAPHVATDVAYTRAAPAGGPPAARARLALGIEAGTPPGAGSPAADEKAAAPGTGGRGVPAIDPTLGRPARVRFLILPEALAARLPPALLGARLGIDVAAPASLDPPRELYHARAALLADADIFVAGAVNRGGALLAERRAALFRGVTLLVAARRDARPPGPLRVGIERPRGVERATVLIGRHEDGAGTSLDVAIEVEAPPRPVPAEETPTFARAAAALGARHAGPSPPGRFGAGPFEPPGRVPGGPPAAPGAEGGVGTDTHALILLASIPLPADGGAAVVVAVPSPFSGRGPSTLGVVVEVGPPVGPSPGLARRLGGALDHAIGSLAREAALARADRAAGPMPPPRRPFPGVQALREGLGPGPRARPRETLLALGLSTGARACEVVAASLDDDRLALVAALVAGTMAALPADSGADATGLAAEKACLGALDELLTRELGERGPVSDALERRGGPALADHGAIRREVEGAGSLEALERSLVSRNVDLLDHAGASTRLSAARWLRHRGLRLGAYDPLAPAADRQRAARAIRLGVEASP